MAMLRESYNVHIPTNAVKTAQVATNYSSRAYTPIVVTKSQRFHLI